ncbi:MAG: type I glyceraldehyde-3-phosphate dehydrogenase [Planctomycetota bacterium]|nr:MAG: type I glyceraldehyde-3-phosphate dehydrogenase [Planctomycetota bacterium]
MKRVAINGFGRMGRLVLRAGFANPDYEIVHINEVAGDAACAAHLLAFDSIHGRWHEDEVRAIDDSSLEIRGNRVSSSQSKDPSAVDWAGLGVDLVLECSGAFRTSAKLEGFFKAGAPRVLVAAPVKEAEAANIVFGINHHIFDPQQHRIVTAASCTTNCLAPLIKVVHEQFGIERGCITTIHDATNTQVVMDFPHKDLRRARAQGLSLIPTTTGSATAIALIYPELKGRLDGHAVRVPLFGASLTDAVLSLKKDVTVAEVNAAFQAAAKGPLAGIMGYEHRPLVSIDYQTDPRSCIIDGLQTMVTDGRLLKVYAWYDNEWGYVNRMHELAAHILTQA